MSELNEKQAETILDVAAIAKRVAKNFAKVLGYAALALLAMAWIFLPLIVMDPTTTSFGGSLSIFLGWMFFWVAFVGTIAWQTEEYYREKRRR